MANYSMNDLQRLLDRTPQSIRQVFKKVDSIRALLPQHRTVTPNKKVFFDDTILAALQDYYGLTENPHAVDDVVGGGDENTENPENPQTNPPPPPVEDNIPDAAEEQELAGLQAKIKALEKEIQEQQEKHKKETEDLEKQLQDKEAERLHFIGENSKLLSLLAAEKQEKDKLLLLLPPAAAERKGVWSKFKGLFSKSKGGVTE